MGALIVESVLVGVFAAIGDDDSAVKKFPALVVLVLAGKAEFMADDMPIDIALLIEEVGFDTALCCPCPIRNAESPLLEYRTREL